MNNTPIILLLTLLIILTSGCTKLGLVPNPPNRTEEQKAIPPHVQDMQTESAWADEASPATARGIVRTREVDFARAFEEEPAPRDTAPPPPLPPAVSSLRYPPFQVQMRPVRVMLKRNLKELAFNSPANAQLRSPNASLSFRGNLQIETLPGRTEMVVAVVNRVKKEVSLPCTLRIAGGSSDANMFSIDGSRYRSDLIIVSEERGTFSVINLIPVEEYLRGVVPLEIGNLRESDIEAVKAQAVAARTYTYKRMAANRTRHFDLLSTVADQVYGGANAEGATSDNAILHTKDLIMGYENEIVGAFYHSTCGGRTANIEDVWGGRSFPYLRSISDTDENGRAFCAGSSAFTWTETWAENQLVGVIKRHSADGHLNPAFRGSGLRKIEAVERFECGRIKRLAVVSSAGHEHFTGGDRTRWLLRRGNARQILRSSNFDNATIEGGRVTITGRGYGHGIGMCQVGAIGRARAGQGFEQILRTYYSGMLIRTVAGE